MRTRRCSREGGRRYLCRSRMCLCHSTRSRSSLSCCRESYACSLCRGLRLCSTWGKKWLARMLKYHIIFVYTHIRFCEILWEESGQREHTVHLFRHRGFIQSELEHVSRQYLTLESATPGVAGTLQRPFVRHSSASSQHMLTSPLRAEHGTELSWIELFPLG